MSDKAIEACKVYVLRSMDIKRLTSAIGNALSNCPGKNGKLLRWDYEAEADETHLAAAYRRQAVEGGAIDFMGCAHCAEAHSLITERKHARQSLGAAKRWIAKLGREAIRSERKKTA